MKNRTWYILLAAFTLVIVALRVFALNPERVEACYSTGFYVVLCNAVSGVTTTLPFSLFELLIGASLLGAVVLHIVWFRRWRKEKWPFRHTALSILLRYAAAAMILYTWFLVFWGLNYYRLPLAEKAGYPEARAEDRFEHPLKPLWDSHDHEMRDRATYQAHAKNNDRQHGGENRRPEKLGSIPGGKQSGQHGDGRATDNESHAGQLAIGRQPREKSRFL